MQIQIGNGTNYTVAAATNNMTTGRHVLVGVYDGTTLSLYIDGILAGTPVSATTISQYTGAMTVGGQAYSSHDEFLAMWGRALSDAEIVQLSKNPYQICRAIVPKAYHLTPNVYTLAMGQGSFALTGRTAGLLRTLSLPASVGTFALTGQTNMMSAGFQFTANQGVYSLTGQNAGFVRALRLNIGQGAFSLSGQVATLTANFRGQLGAQFRSSSTSGTGADTNLVINKPTGTAAGDLLIALVGTDNTNTGVSAPSGWTAAFVNDGPGPDGGQYSLYYKIAGSSEPSTYTWTFTGGGYVAGIIACYQSINSGFTVLTPAHNVASTTGSPFTMAGPAGSTAANNTLNIWLGATDYNSLWVDGSRPVPTDYTGRVSFIDGTTWFAFRVGDKVESLGSWGTTSASWNNTYSNSSVMTFVYVIPVAPKTSSTLTADQGSFTYTGQTAALKYNRTIVAVQGSYALNGQTINLRASRILPCTQGAYSLNGQNASLLWNARISMTAGAYAFTGQSVGFYRGLRLVAAAGTFTYLGQSVGLSRSAYLRADAGLYTLDGIDAALTLAARVSAAPGAYSVAGQNAGVSASRSVLAGQGAYSLTGQTLAFVRHLLLTGSQGSYTFSGKDIQFAASNRIVVSEGVFSLAGQAARFERHLISHFAAGNFAFNGIAAALKKSAYLGLAQGSYTFNGEAAAFYVHRHMPAENGSFALAGYETSAFHARSILAQQGGFVFNGQAVDLKSVAPFVRSVERTLAIDNQNRVLGIDDQNRALMLGDQNRQLSIGGQDRRITIN